MAKEQRKNEQLTKVVVASANDVDASILTSLAKCRTSIISNIAIRVVINRKQKEDHSLAAKGAVRGLGDPSPIGERW